VTGVALGIAIGAVIVGIVNLYIQVRRHKRG